MSSIVKSGGPFKQKIRETELHRDRLDIAATLTIESTLKASTGLLITNMPAAATATVYLPSAQPGMEYGFVKKAASLFLVAPVSGGSDTIGGASATVTIANLDELIDLQCLNSGAWTYNRTPKGAAGAGLVDSVNGLTGDVVLSINDLADVTISAPVSLAVLAYNATAGTWNNRTGFARSVNTQSADTFTQNVSLDADDIPETATRFWAIEASADKSPVTQVNSRTGAVNVSGADVAGTLALRDLSDVSAAAIVTGQTLQWNSAGAYFENVSAAGGVAPIDTVQGRTGAVSLSAADVQAMAVGLSALGNVTISAPASGEGLVYQSAADVWVNTSINVPVSSVQGRTGSVSLSTGDIVSLNLTANVLADISIVAIADNQRLAWNSASQQWVNVVPASAGGGTVTAVNAQLPNVSGSVSLDADDIPETGTRFWAAETGAQANTVTSVQGRGGVVSISAGDIVNMSISTAQLANVTTSTIGLGHVFAFDPVQAKFTNRALSSIVPVPSIQGRTGAVSLSAGDISAMALSVGQLGDVSLSSISDNQVLVWSSGDAQWKNTDSATGAVDSVQGRIGIVSLSAADINAMGVALNQLANVTLSSPGTAHTLTYNSASDEWSNVAARLYSVQGRTATVSISAGDISALSVGVGQLGDVTLSALSAGNLLIWSSTGGFWTDIDVSSVVLVLGVQGRTGDISISAGDVSAMGVGTGQLADMSVAGIADTQILKWDGGQSKFVPADSSAGGGGTVTAVNAVTPNISGSVSIDADDIPETATRFWAVEAGAQANTVDNVQGRTGAISISAQDISAAGVTIAQLASVSIDVATLSSRPLLGWVSAQGKWVNRGGYARVVAGVSVAMFGTVSLDADDIPETGSRFWALSPGAQGNSVDSVFGREGAVVATSADYSAAQVGFTNTLTSVGYSISADGLQSALNFIHKTVPVVGEGLSPPAAGVYSKPAWWINSDPADDTEPAFWYLVDDTNTAALVWSPAAMGGGGGGADLWPVQGAAFTSLPAVRNRNAPLVGLTFAASGRGFGMNTRHAYQKYVDTDLSANLPVVVHCSTLNGGTGGAGRFKTLAANGSTQYAGTGGTLQPTILVFDVGGEMTLSGPGYTAIDQQYLWVCGQTAPGNGVYIRTPATRRYEPNPWHCFYQHMAFQWQGAPSNIEGPMQILPQAPAEQGMTVFDHCAFMGGEDKQFDIAGFNGVNFHDYTWIDCLFGPASKQASSALSIGMLLFPGSGNASSRDFSLIGSVLSRAWVRAPTNETENCAVVNCVQYGYWQNAELVQLTAVSEMNMSLFGVWSVKGQNNPGVAGNVAIVNSFNAGLGLPTSTQLYIADNYHPDYPAHTGTTASVSVLSSPNLNVLPSGIVWKDASDQRELVRTITKNCGPWPTSRDPDVSAELLGIVNDPQYGGTGTALAARVTGSADPGPWTVYATTSHAAPGTHPAIQSILDNHPATNMHDVWNIATSAWESPTAAKVAIYRTRIELALLDLSESLLKT